MFSDVLTQARTPTPQEAAQVSAVSTVAARIDYGVAGRVLALAAPRILALAYRDAARMVEWMEMGGATECGILCGDTLAAVSVRLEARATALEEGTPA